VRLTVLRRQAAPALGVRGRTHAGGVRRSAQAHLAARTLLGERADLTRRGEHRHAGRANRVAHQPARTLAREAAGVSRLAGQAHAAIGHAFTKATLGAAAFDAGAARHGQHAAGLVEALQAVETLTGALTRRAVGAKGGAEPDGRHERRELAVERAATLAVVDAGVVEQRAGLAGARAGRAAADAFGALGESVVTVTAERYAGHQEARARIRKLLPLGARLGLEHFCASFGARRVVLQAADRDVRRPGHRATPGRLEGTLAPLEGLCVSVDEAAAREVVAALAVEQTARFRGREPCVGAHAAVLLGHHACVQLPRVRWAGRREEARLEERQREEEDDWSERRMVLQGFD
jgi:hypothetical protein